MWGALSFSTSLLHLTVSLPSLSIPFCVKTVNIQELAPLEMPSFTLILFLSSCLRTLPIWNPACDSSTRRGKRLSRLRAPCPQSPPPLSGPGGLRLRHGPHREAEPPGSWGCALHEALTSAPCKCSDSGGTLPG